MLLTDFVNRSVHCVMQRLMLKKCRSYSHFGKKNNPALLEEGITSSSLMTLKVLINVVGINKPENLLLVIVPVSYLQHAAKHHTGPIQ